MKFKKIGRRYESIKRYREIGHILIKYGFYTLSEKMGLLGKFKKLTINGKNDLNKKYTMAQRLRMAIEELGPTFIKLGQILSTRYDILPTDIVNELSLLQDKVSEFDLGIAKKIFKDELGVEISEVFQYFNEKPLAAASIG